ncbi:TetR/AcrR family transcriptional regulator [Luteibacter aegosomatissinici]|uniref:TetR/AcrR family transcriptional regulator n=1 Tax=Luteibacter aegosomatissinici TaxID=2911539 RepID=UPI001FF79B36|nr:TetR/AcrR family transcriptional regulator [Luteibacter aegosomatissinici]UPG94456.1 TetR/AcrR family transcriptional regulator [Luteibacter aegosomatissinici]
MNDIAASQPRPAGPRPGGRSARVQAAIHQAVHELQAEGAREALTVPAIAARAGVTPSTIYRRWGDLSQLLADVAVEQLRPEGLPADTGTYRGDLFTWLEQYRDEMSSGPGRTMLRDVLGVQGRESTGKCAFYCTQQLDAINARAIARDEPTLATQDILDSVVAPMMYRILFTAGTPDANDVGSWLDALMTRNT